jgi:hypothetical protein
MKQLVEAALANEIEDQHRDICLQATHNKADQVCVAILELKDDLIHNVVTMLNYIQHNKNI